MANKNGKRQQGSRQLGNQQKSEHRQLEQHNPHEDQPSSNSKLGQKTSEQFDSDNPSIVKSEN